MLYHMNTLLLHTLQPSLPTEEGRELTYSFPFSVASFSIAAIPSMIIMIMARPTRL